MNENFERDINQTGETPQEKNENMVKPENTNFQQPTPNFQPVYGNTNQYMPYGVYAPVKNPEAEKKSSKGKKKGLVVAAIIFGITVVVAIAVFAMAVINADSTPIVPDEPETKDETQMNFAEVPEDNGDVVVSGDVLSANQIYQKVYESSVGIIVYSGNRQQVSAEGSGVVMGLNNDGTGVYIITCAHVLDVSNAKIVVQTADGTQYDAKLIGKDSKTDISVLYVANSSLKPAEFANSDTLGVGDTIYAIGNPGGMEFFGSFTNGMISAIGRPVDSPVGYEVACIQHTAPINPGNSGGALVNAYGQVIGINSSKIASTDFEGMGFAVPSSTVKEVVDQLIKDGRVTNRPALGIKFMPTIENQAYASIVKNNNLPAGSIIIDTIMVGSDLENKGVKEGDIIIGVNGQELDDYNMILDLVESGKVGDVLTLEICHVDSNYQVSTFDVKVALVEDSSVSEPKENESQSIPYPFGN